jgi:hypothetical protein
MGLPTELRLMIYDFALQANIDSITSAPPSPLSLSSADMIGPRATKRLLPFLGGLALHHTNQTIRGESLYDFLSFLHIQKRAILRRMTDLTTASRAAIDADDYHKASVLHHAWLDVYVHYDAVDLLWDRGFFCRYGHRLFERNAPVAGNVAVPEAEDHKSEE